ncbi:MAG TPA: hypothetical protein PLJ89_10925 [Thermoleophilia bacterium]|nr:hypothetical protein [Thermoleophilia bacterium]
MSDRRAYGSIRSMVEKLGGSMVWARRGYRYGAWIVTIADRRMIIPASGEQSFPQLDGLLVPLKAHPRTWNDYTNDLLPDAESRLLAMLRDAPPPEPFPRDQEDALAELIERTHWRFSWTLARTYPHEYTTLTKERCAPDDHARLIDCIERYGVLERYRSEWRMYFHFRERKYWHMGDPYSRDPEQRPNVINRTWLDVRRHEENVRYGSWTDEEIELQKRIWEIRLEETTDYVKTRP